MKIVIFTGMKIRCMLHGRVFVMLISIAAHIAFCYICSMSVYLFNYYCLFSIIYSYPVYKKAVADIEGEVDAVKHV